MKITVVTERKIIDVVPGYSRGSADRVEVDVCVSCGSVVFDPDAARSLAQVDKPPID